MSRMRRDRGDAFLPDLDAVGGVFFPGRTDFETGSAAEEFLAAVTSAELFSEAEQKRHDEMEIEAVGMVSPFADDSDEVELYD
jgi:hypothetical protein